jgi:hypothetical protein
MKSYIPALLSVLVLFAACDSNTTKEGKTATDSTVSEKKSVTECYDYFSNKDSISLHITITGRSVAGELLYKIFEKDQNKGSLQGEMHQDTLLAEYTFISEGIESVREIAFLKKENAFAEGYGEAEEKDGKLVFKNAGALNFSNTVILKKSDCR